MTKPSKKYCILKGIVLYLALFNMRRDFKMLFLKKCSKENQINQKG